MAKVEDLFLPEEILREALKCHKIKFLKSDEEDGLILYGEVCTGLLLLNEKEEEFFKVVNESNYDLTLVLSYGIIKKDILKGIEEIKRYIKLADSYKKDIILRTRINKEKIGEKKEIDHIRKVAALFLNDIKRFIKSNSNIVFTQDYKNVIREEVDRLLRKRYFNVCYENIGEELNYVKEYKDLNIIDTYFLAYNHIFVVSYLFNSKTKVNLPKDVMMNPSLIKLIVLINPIKEDLIVKSRCNSWILIDGLRGRIIETDFPKRH